MALDFNQNEQTALGLLVTAPYVTSYISRLGGGPTLMVTISLDARPDWVNGILQNSRYANFSIDSDGTVEHFSGSLPKFRKCKVASIDEAAKKINAWAAKITA